MYEKTTSTLKALFFHPEKNDKTRDRQTDTSEERVGEGIYKSKEGLQFYDCIQTIIYYIIIGNIYEEKIKKIKKIHV